MAFQKERRHSRLQDVENLALRILFLFLTFSLFVCLPFATAAPLLVMSVQTDKPSYSISENITVYGLVLENGVPVSSASVALEVQNPAATPVITRSAQTNSSGAYIIVFKLSSEALAGSYNVYVSCTHGGETALNSTSFQASNLVVTVGVGNDSYRVGDDVSISGNVTLNNTRLSGVLVAVEVEDPNMTPMTVRVLETEVQGGYGFVFQFLTGSPMGNYSVFASVNYQGLTATARTWFFLKPKIVSADINGDGRVNILDLTLVALAFGTHPGDPRWNPMCDLNGDNGINILDITQVALAWTLTT